MADERRRDATARGWKTTVQGAFWTVKLPDGSTRSGTAENAQSALSAANKAAGGSYGTCGSCGSTELLGVCPCGGTVV